MYAIVETGGRQYRVEPGQVVVVERLPGEEGAEIEIDRCLMVAGDQGETWVGTPYVPGAKVVAQVLRQERGPKILVFKYKPKVNYRRRQGHRQNLTRLKVLAIHLPEAAS
ncbi:MAG: 50S ribosomal protein L21 [Firmicutes bacterium]|nr:50S ribosomal protein L21 [Alicyclobacillaceae bacterium]MCL6496975.1 50S ribosomal protein L21 [Bacillota bacterium]